MNNKTKVTLRKKAVTKGRQSLYLDFYPPIVNIETNKPTRREFLKLYLYVKPRNPIEKMENDETLRIANLIKNKRQTELSKDNIYSEFEKGQLQINAIGEESFIEYLKAQAEKRNGKNYSTWLIAIQHFVDFSQGRNLKFIEVTVPLINDFKDYLLNVKSKRKSIDKLSNNTALSYFNRIKATLKRAYKEGKLRVDINSNIESIKEKETKRNFLTLEEANRLAKTDCKNELVKKVSLFSILTGMRYIDIENLKWSEIEHFEDGYYIRYKQQKTNGQETLPINNQAFELLGERKESTDLVFNGLKKWDVNRILPKWIEDAKIKKHITFHCFRHTFATLQINGGTELYAVSKMLGHREIKTTQIYTNILDLTKRVASNKINLDL